MAHRVSNLWRAMRSALRSGARYTSSLPAILLAVALAIILPFASLLGYLGYVQVSREKSRIQHEALVQARMLAAEIETHVAARLGGLAAAAAAVAASNGDVATIEEQMWRFRRSVRDVERALVLDQFGRVLASAPPMADGRRLLPADQEWFRRAATSMQPLVGGPQGVGPDLVVRLYAPARAPGGQFRGVVAADLTLRGVDDLLRRTRLEAGGVAEVLTEQGLVVARQPVLIQNVQGLPAYRALVDGQDGVGEAVLDDGERRLAGVASIRSLGWVLSVGLPPSPVLAQTERLLGHVAATAVAAALLGLALTFVVASRTARGINSLHTAVSRLEAGCVPASVPVTAGGEVGALTEAFNRVLDRLRRQLHDDEALRQLEEASSTTTIGNCSLDTVAPHLLRKVVGGMGADAGLMLLQTQEGLITKSAIGFWGVPAEKITPRRGHGLASAVVRDREPVIVHDVESDRRVEAYIKSSGLRSIIAVPMLSGDRVIGVVEVGFRAPGALIGGELHRLQSMVRPAVQVLEHVRALEVVPDLETDLAILRQKAALATAKLRAAVSVGAAPEPTTRDVGDESEDPVTQ